MSAAKRKLKTLSLAEKLQVLEAVKYCKKRKDVAKQFGIPMSTLSSIVKKESDIMKKIENGQNLSCKRQRLVKFPGLEECLLKWFSQCWKQNISVSGSLLQEQAEIYSKSLGLVNFKASNGWLDKFKKRHEIVFKRISGESANIKICDKWKSEVGGLVQDYEAKNIYNAKETGLFFKSFPDDTLSVDNDQCHGEKHSKERLTILLAANMSGTDKLSPLVIGNEREPRIFSTCNFPLKYEANPKARITTEIFSNWLTTIDNKMAKKKRKILLLIENCEVYKDLPHMQAITIKYLPANISSKLQPMNYCINKHFKTLYRKEVMSMPEEEKESTIDVLQAIRLVNKAWRNVTECMIKNCYTQCGFPIVSSEETNVKNNSIEPAEEWDTVVSEPEICLEDFVTCDDGNITVETIDITDDDEIIVSKPQNTETKDLNDIDNLENTCAPLVSVKEARIALNTLRSFIEQNSNSEEKEFCALNIIDNVIDRVESNLKEKK